MSTQENASYKTYPIAEQPSETRGGQTWCIGNGQIHDAISPSYEVCKTLNCMIDPMKILVYGEINEESL